MEQAARSVLVTGAARGLGRDLAIGLAARGWQVAVLDRNAEGVQATAQRIRDDGGRVLALGCDLTRDAEVADAISSLLDEFGALDGVVANAGGADGERIPFLDLNLEVWNRMLDRNLTAAFLTGLHSARAMVARGSGSIVFISSVGATVAQPDLAHYAAAKAGVAQLARGMAAELGVHGVRVNAVAPGSVLTEGNRHLMKGTAAGDAWMARTALRRLGSTVDLIGAVSYLLSDDAQYTTGATLAVDGGFALA